MKLMTKAIEKRFGEVWSQKKSKDPVVILKLFNPCGAQTWYATEFDPERKTFFGYVDLYGNDDGEWGYFYLDELQELKCPPLGLGIERDSWFEEKKISKVSENARNLIN